MESSFHALRATPLFFHTRNARESFIRREL
jgi:hypothetical protein